MKNGHLDSNFINVVDTFINDFYHGNCKVFEVDLENYFYEDSLNIICLQDTFLLYNSGEMNKGIKTGKWIYSYVLKEDDNKFYNLIFKEVTYTKGLKNGEFKYFFESGKVSSRGNYKNNKLDGLILIYNQKGIIVSSMNYRNNKLDGLEILYDNEGNIISKRNYKNGKLNGQTIDYYINGNIKQITNYSDNLMSGKFQFFYENGNKWVEKNYKKGLLWNLKYNLDLNGNKKDTGFFKNGNGEEFYYTLEGKLYAVKHYSKGKIVETKFID